MGDPVAPQEQQLREDRIDDAPPVVIPLSMTIEGFGRVADAVAALTNNTCRWPLGDPRDSDFRFCGRPGADFSAKKPYCPDHMRA
jgi:GcrA cell cycle regulator